MCTLMRASIYIHTHAERDGTVVKKKQQKTMPLPAVISHVDWIRLKRQYDLSRGGEDDVDSAAAVITLSKKPFADEVVKVLYDGRLMTVLDKEYIIARDMSKTYDIFQQRNNNDDGIYKSMADALGVNSTSRSEPSRKRKLWTS